jgi:CheY-like chemotaxis protein
MQRRFIIVDDDPVNNMVCTFLINKVVGDAEVKSFILPAQGLEYIRLEYTEDSDQPETILLLDINMPEITGWEFLRQFALMNNHIHKNITIYMASSSIDPLDREKAKTEIFVEDFIEKPLCPGVLEGMLETLRNKAGLACG